MLLVLPIAAFLRVTMIPAPFSTRLHSKQLLSSGAVRSPAFPQSYDATPLWGCAGDGFPMPLILSRTWC
jgi:hypothetical protein